MLRRRRDLVRCKVPALDGLVGAASEEEAFGRGVDNSENCFLMVSETFHAFQRVQVPDSHSLVVARREQAVALAVNCKARHPVGVSRKSRSALKGRKVPALDVAVIGPGEQH
eukprot:CAMPEP_0196667990 /NCGR_PEP_ID=MMETSP1086-20130531/65384_1 /TAXON_ID=77921 /ORGANISM="Cyanoptyche  gloeocystis , Strain SAG4.97" /LENGTH=111 /DNA_ID=CAMNT_0042005369 /DNA_START=942 /DNA_END=1277 /DNA_ORIENTATION=+